VVRDEQLSTMLDLIDLGSHEEHWRCWRVLTSWEEHGLGNVFKS
jgi:hypothetical protein